MQYSHGLHDLVAAVLVGPAMQRAPSMEHIIQRTRFLEVTTSTVNKSVRILRFGQEVQGEKTLNLHQNS